MAAAARGYGAPASALRAIVLQHLAELLAQLRRVLVAVHVGGVQRGGADDLVLLAGDGEAALRLTGELTTVCDLACHVNAPPTCRWGPPPPMASERRGPRSARLVRSRGGVARGAARQAQRRGSSAVDDRTYEEDYDDEEIGRASCRERV